MIIKRNTNKIKKQTNSLTIKVCFVLKQQLLTSGQAIQYIPSTRISLARMLRCLRSNNKKECFPNKLQLKFPLNFLSSLERFTYTSKLPPAMKSTCYFQQKTILFFIRNTVLSTSSRLQVNSSFSVSLTFKALATLFLHSSDQLKMVCAFKYLLNKVFLLH